MSSIPDFSLLIDQIRAESMRADLYRSEEGLRIVRLFSKSLDAISVLSFMAKFYEEKSKGKAAGTCENYCRANSAYALVGGIVCQS